MSAFLLLSSLAFTLHHKIPPEHTSAVHQVCSFFHQDTFSVRTYLARNKPRHSYITYCCLFSLKIKLR